MQWRPSVGRRRCESSMVKLHKPIEKFSIGGCFFQRILRNFLEQLFYKVPSNDLCLLLLWCLLLSWLVSPSYARIRGREFCGTFEILNHFQKLMVYETTFVNYVLAN